MVRVLCNRKCDVGGEIQQCKMESNCNLTQSSQFCCLNCLGNVQDPSHNIFYMVTGKTICRRANITEISHAFLALLFPFLSVGIR